MANLNDIVTVNVRDASSALSRLAFNAAGILGILPTDVATAWGTDKYRLYSSVEELEADGAVSSDALHKAATALKSQEPSISSFYVLRRSAAVAKVVTVTITDVANSTDYTVTVNGTTHTITSDGSAVNTEIRDALIAAIQGGAQAAKVTAALASATTFTITSDTAGLDFTCTVGAKLSVAVTTANNGPNEDLAAVREVFDGFYGLTLAERNDDLQLQLATYVQSLSSRKFYFMQSDTAAIYDGSSTTDLAYLAKASSLSRTAGFYHDDDTEYLDSAVVGLMFTKAPGVANYAARSLTGIPADDALTSTQAAAILAKNFNTYQTIGGVGWTRNGKTCSGKYIDDVMADDWVANEMQVRIAEALHNVDERIPFTDSGLAFIGTVMRGVLADAVTRGFYATYTVSVPKASEFTSAERQTRAASRLTWSAVRAGAINSVTVNGTVTY
jgi:hypothetical protein